ncbi:MAG: porphobilinogen synthase [Actinomycetota bacterium]|nr:porphobilinogen synthase [Actinomycetota bacterium]
MTASAARPALPERPRRLRRTPAIRRLVRETTVDPAGLVLPVFVRQGAGQPMPIGSMPGVVQHSESSFRATVLAAAEARIGGLMVFGVPDTRDPHGDAACDEHSVLAEAVRWAKEEAGDALPVIADLCLDEFTSHGHCGVLDADGNVDNDATLAVYRRMALAVADAGADILGLSGMMDGQVAAVRAALDDAGRTDVAILAYAAKYASAFYGPFREAVESQLDGDRRAYQQDPANRREALREVRLDVAEGADIVMVKPALAYLDVIADVSAAVDVPTAAYVVSGEYAMVEAAAAAGMIDRERTIMEVLGSVNRAGAGIIATYWALEATRLLARA